MSALTKLLRALLILSWLLACTLILEAGIAGIRSPTDPQLFGGAVIFYYGFRTVAFPLGLLVPFVVEGLLSHLGPWGIPSSPEAQMWVTGLAVTVVGYLQWFHLVPWLFRLGMRSRHSSARVSLELDQR